MTRLMTRVAIVLGLGLYIVSFAWTQVKSPEPEQQATAGAVSPDEVNIRESITRFVELYNSHKANEVAELYAIDARMTFRDGTEINGREEIAKSLAAAFAETPTCAISVVVDSIRFLTPDVAVEEGTTQDFPDGATQTSRNRYVVLHVKKDGKWAMQSVRVEEQESLSAYRELQPLEWMIGDWIDEGQSENVETTFRWDDNKSFLLEEFRVIRQGQVVLQGTQRIGWDPQAKQLRSWIFDTTGGFSEATWTNLQETWLSKAKGVSAEGVSTSATRLLTRATANRLICTLKDRIAGEEALPEITVTMVRKAPEPK